MDCTAGRTTPNWQMLQGDAAKWCQGRNHVQEIQENSHQEMRGSTQGSLKQSLVNGGLKQAAEIQPHLIAPGHLNASDNQTAWAAWGAGDVVHRTPGM